MTLQYRTLRENELCRKLFRGFIRRQIVTKCWRRENGIWVVKDAPFTDDWSEEDYQTLIFCLKNTVSTGGVVYAALQGDVLKGFASVEPDFFGGENKYLDLSSIHVSEDVRGAGIGASLFRLAKEWAKKKAVYLCSFSGRNSGVLQENGVR